MSKGKVRLGRASDGVYGEPACEDCAGSYAVVGTPRFEDQVVHVKVRCDVCGAEYWQLFNHYQNVYDRTDCGLDLEV